VICIRPERDGDQAAIFAVEQAAFAEHPYSQGAEPYIVDALRADGDLLLSLVAEDEGVIVGHVAFSPPLLSDGSTGWVTLGPIGVAPTRQGEGIGRALIEEGARILHAQGAKGMILLGDPALYSRFGFRQGTPITLDGPLAEYLQVWAFGADIPAARVSFSPAYAQVRVPEP
jgi:putative acetyltransferase